MKQGRTMLLTLVLLKLLFPKHSSIDSGRMQDDAQGKSEAGIKDEEF